MLESTLMRNGYFITFEGVEGSGKTTQIKKLAAYLESKGCDVLITREPGGTLPGAVLRELILDIDTQFHSDYTELLLFIADRLEHVEQVIKPAVERGGIVICDRYIDSTRAYQIGGRSMPEELVERLINLVDFNPDLTFLLDIDPETGVNRAKMRGDANRFEEESMAFHSLIRHYYLKLAEDFPERICKLSVHDLTVEQVFDRIQPFIDEKVSN